MLPPFWGENLNPPAWPTLARTLHIAYPVPTPAPLTAGEKGVTFPLCQWGSNINSIEDKSFCTFGDKKLTTLSITKTDKKYLPRYNGTIGLQV